MSRDCSVIKISASRPETESPPPEVPDGPFNVKINIVFPNEIQGKYDIGMIAVRANYTADALNTVLPHLADNGLLVSMQNGINPPLLQEKVGADRTVGDGCLDEAVQMLRSLIFTQPSRRRRCGRGPR